MDGLSPCEVCSKESTILCHRCGVATYCSPVHQLMDWKLHADFCKLFRPFLVAKNEELGEHLVASCDLPAEFFFTIENPLIMGPPTLDTTDKLVCVTCLKTPVEDFCENCGWSVCSRQCTITDIHRIECAFVKEHRGTKIDMKSLFDEHPLYKYLLIIRCLSLKESYPLLWDKLLKMKSKNSNRIQDPSVVEAAAVYMADSISSIFRLKSNFKYSELLLVCKIFQVNAFIVKMEDCSYTVLYSLASMVSHSCIPNVTRTFSRSGKMFMKTHGPVKKDEPIVMAYADVLLGTVPRRQQLAKKFIDCQCRRCKDRTELGTYYSAVLCKEIDCDGAVLMDKPLEEGGSWSCSYCSQVTSATDIEALVDEAARDMESVNFYSLQECEQMLDRWCLRLHRNHYILMTLRVRLSQLYENNPNETLRQHKTRLRLRCQLLWLTERLLPGTQRLHFFPDNVLPDVLTSQHTTSGHE